MPDSKNLQTDICYIVSHGFAVRMILQTNLLGQLRDKGLRVALISPDDKDPVLTNYCEQNQIELFGFKSGKWIWKSNYMLYRSYFLEDIEANPILYEKHYYEIHHSKRKLLRWIPYVLMGFQHLTKVFPGIQKSFLWIENRLLQSKPAVDLLKAINPKLIIATYPVNPHEGTLLHNANKLKITSTIHLLSWDNITSKGRFMSMANYYLAWGETMKNEYIEKYNIPLSSIFITGVPHFDLHTLTRHQANNSNMLNQFGLDPSKPFLFFGMSSPRFVPKEIDIVEYISKQINNNTYGMDMQMIIRPHPQNIIGGMADLSWLSRIKQLENNRIKIFFPLLAESKLPWSMELEDMNKLSALLSSCIVCINSCSTLSIDTLMAGRGNIAPMFDGNDDHPYWYSAKRLLEYIHIKKFVASGGTQVTNNFQELDVEILKYVSNIDYNILNREQALLLECANDNGNGTIAVVNQIDTLLKAL